MNALIGTLRDDELDLLRATEPDRMAALDEDDLLDLHTRVRRARTKYVKLYRRQASTQVKKSGGRGKGRPKNRRNADKAEAFEDALARVSRRVTIVARKAAKKLKNERLAAAAKETTRPRETGRESPKGKPQSRPRAHTKTTGGRKRDASTQAKGARRQAKRDKR
jgi:hypothetical protein